MLYQSRAIVIKTVKYSESSVIAKLYTEKFGIQSYMVKGLRSSKSSSFKPAQLLTLNLLEIVAYRKQQSDLQSLKELRCSPPLQQLHQHFIKSAVGMFVAELLHRCVQEQESNPALYAFLHQCIEHLDQATESLANFPAWFTLQLSAYLGFRPQGEAREESPYFSLEDGDFVQSAALGSRIVSRELSKALHLLNNCDIQQYASHHFSHVLRNELLEQLIQYYNLHQLNLGQIKSHKVLAEVLG